MDKQTLPKRFDFRQEESRLYAEWERKGYFKPWNDPRKPGFDPSVEPFVISMPPPNVTGELHLGHAMMVAVEDMLMRQKRMEGKPALWVPGTDHAGIATQLMVERALAREGKTRYDLGRQAFEERVWAWKRKYGGIITTQIRRLGASCDWEREKFTLDPDLYRAVMEAFVRLWEKGLIYRGYRVINWSPGLQTAVSDLEVEYKEVQGKLYFFKYMLADDSGEYIPVATTRPETILGDTAVAVHPEDPRYRAYVGREVVVPILGRRIPVIADERVDREFGTGALKITPGHDPTDFEIGRDHGLPVRIVMDERGYMNALAGPYAGLERFEARARLWEDMRAAGLVIKEEPYTHRIPVAQRGGEPIEPLASVQWFVRIEPLARRALQAVREGRIRIIPERFTKVYYHWLENIRDWTISRQLWWGHRIPAWYCMDCTADDGRRQAEHVRFIFNPPLEVNGRQVEVATYAELEAQGLARPDVLEKAAHMKVDLAVKPIVAREAPERCPVCGSTRLVQEADVLDTWFSSGLWPFSTLGWPEDTPDYRYFYPTTVMETGYDILFFWVARMIMMGLEFTDQVPFRIVYLHGLVRDEHGRKMSKTLGNVIDPLEVIEQYGTDALRFTLLVGNAPGNDLNLSMKKIAANRNFANKVWNLGRFVLGRLPQVPRQPQGEPAWTLADSWIWARLQDLIRQVNALLERYLLGEAGKLIYEFLWNEFADWYVEMAKPQLAAGGDRAYYTMQALVKVLDAGLRLLHPYTPFVTEALWGHLKAAVQAHFGPRAAEFAFDDAWADMLIVAPWPRTRAPEGWEDDKVRKFAQLQALVRAIRHYRAEQQLDPKTKLAARVVAGDDAADLATVREGLALLARLDPAQTEIVAQGAAPEGAAAMVAGSWVAYLRLPRLDPAARARLEKKLAQVEAQIARLEKQLAGPFAQKAPPQVVQREREKLARYREEAATLRRQLGG